MSQPVDSASSKSNKDKKVKLIFILIIAVGAIGITMFQRKLAPPKGWINNDLPKAMRLAEEKGGNVVVLFVGRTPSQLDRWMRDRTLSKEANRQALADGNFTAVMVRVSRGQRKDIAEKYGVTEFPTTLILTPAGEELNRAAGKIGEALFRNEFLAKALSP